jgi:hypothetical protein
VNLRASYTPSDVGLGLTPTLWSYDVHGRLDFVSRRDDQDIDLAYDSADRLDLTSSSGETRDRSTTPRPTAWSR